MERLFATRTDATAPVRVVLAGAGAMGRAWMRVLVQSADVELVGVVDLDPGLADAALAEEGLSASGIAVGADLTEIARRTSAEAVVNVTVPAAHVPVGLEALRAGLPVLSEKPAAPTVAEALRLADAADDAGQLLMISQSRRYYRTLTLFREQVRSLGELGFATTLFFRAPRFGGFREEMRHVLLVDMAIHAFDAARYLLEQDPVSAYCHEFNPRWSWYADGAAATAVFELDGGAVYSYTGSWCSPGLETSWNGAWRVSGAGGTATWDGESEPSVERVDGVATSISRPDPGPEEIAGALADFVTALRTGAVPSGEVHANIRSLAMVEAAVLSAERGRRVLIEEVLAGGIR